MTTTQYSAILRYLGKIEGLTLGVEDETIQAELIAIVDKIVVLLAEAYL